MPVNAPVILRDKLTRGLQSSSIVNCVRFLKSINSRLLNCRAIENSIYRRHVPSRFRRHSHQGKWSITRGRGEEGWKTGILQGSAKRRKKRRGKKYEDSRPFRTSFSPWDFLPERSCRAVSRSRPIGVDNNAQCAINSAGLAISRVETCHAFDFILSHSYAIVRPFLRQGLASKLHRGGSVRTIADCRSAARARSAITRRSGRYSALI